MGNVPLEKMIDKAEGSIYKLVILASKRALELSEGQPALVPHNSAVRPSTIAMEEIAAGKIRAKKINEESKK